MRQDLPRRLMAIAQITLCFCISLGERPVWACWMKLNCPCDNIGFHCVWRTRFRPKVVGTRGPCEACEARLQRVKSREPLRSPHAVPVSLVLATNFNTSVTLTILLRIARPRKNRDTQADPTPVAPRRWPRRTKGPAPPWPQPATAIPRQPSDMRNTST